MRARFFMAVLLLPASTRERATYFRSAPSWAGPRANRASTSCLDPSDERWDRKREISPARHWMASAVAALAMAPPSPGAWGTRRPRVPRATVAAIRSPPRQTPREPHPGVPPARRQGTSASRGDGRPESSAPRRRGARRCGGGRPATRPAYAAPGRADRGPRRVAGSRLATSAPPHSTVTLLARFRG